MPALGVAAGALGVAEACLEACVQFARTRRQFGQRLGDFEMLQGVIARFQGVRKATVLIDPTNERRIGSQSVTRRVHAKP